MSHTCIADLLDLEWCGKRNDDDEGKLGKNAPSPFLLMDLERIEVT